MSAEDYSAGWHPEGDELVRRLSKLEWAPVPDELRERCWKDFEHRMLQNGNAPADVSRSRAAFNVGERYEMRRFPPARRLAAAELPPGAATSATIDSAMLDEIQIVSAWMKQKTRQGAYWQFPPGADPAEVVQSLELWLGEQRDSGAERMAA